MAITIGDKPDKDFDDPVGMLEDCHRRIEKFLDVLLTVADQTRGNALSDEQRAAVRTSLRYFRDAAPKHTADEEDSLFPRMRASQPPGTTGLLSNLDQLHTDHVHAHENHQAVDELFHEWLRDGVLASTQFARLSSLLHSLRETYARHIKEEETQIFPDAARILSPADLKAVGLEMSKRRGL